METQEEQKENFYPHISVDCVLFSIVNECLSVLLIEQKDVSGESIGYKLPGSLIYEKESLDQAAQRVIQTTTYLKRLSIRQFRAFGSPDRTSNPEDVKWLERASFLKIGRIVTIAYLALCKPKAYATTTNYQSIHWFEVDKIPSLPFDHNEIIKEAVKDIRHWVQKEPMVLFDYLPARFTAYQLRRTYEIIYDKKLDVRNFKKKMKMFGYVRSTGEKEKNVAHRAALYYRFDKVKYNQMRSQFSRHRI